MIVATLFSSRPSQAAIGAIVAAPAVVTGGLVIAGLGAGTTLALAVTAGPNDLGAGILMMFFTLPALALGLLVLDGEQGISYSPVSLKDATRLGLSAEELNSFNQEIDQVNALASYVDSEVAQMKDATEDDAAEIWKDVKNEVRPETFSALVKITKQLYK